MGISICKCGHVLSDHYKILNHTHMRCLWDKCPCSKYEFSYIKPTKHTPKQNKSIPKVSIMPD